MLGNVLIQKEKIDTQMKNTDITAVTWGKRRWLMYSEVFVLFNKHDTTGEEESNWTIDKLEILIWLWSTEFGPEKEALRWFNFHTPRSR